MPVRPPGVLAQAPASFALPDDTTLAGAGSLPVDDTPPAPETLPGLAEVRDDAAAHVEALPAADWDIDALASTLAFDPTQAYLFVRDRIGSTRTQGVLRGAEGTLAARAGNALDRALLLAALLDAMGVEHRFAVAELDDVSVDRLLERALAAPVAPLPAPGWRSRASMPTPSRRARRGITLACARRSATASTGSTPASMRRRSARPCVSTHGCRRRSGPAGATSTRPSPCRDRDDLRAGGRNARPCPEDAGTR